MKGRYGSFMVELVLATLLLLTILGNLFEMRSNIRDQKEQQVFLEEFSRIGKAVQAYIDSNKEDLLQKGTFTNIGNGLSVFTSDTAIGSNGYDVSEEISEFLPKDENLRSLRSVMNDAYHVVFIRKDETAEVAQDEENASYISAYVVASGSKTRPSRWPQSMIQKIVLKGGASFGYIVDCTDPESEDATTTYCVKSAGWSIPVVPAETGAGLDDIAQLIVYNEKVVSRDSVSRYSTGDDEDSTMYADIDMNDHNVLNVRHIETQNIDMTGLRIDPTLYSDLAEAENSCANNWIYIRDRELKTDTVNKRFVDSNGDIYSEWTGPSVANPSAAYAGVDGTKMGTFGMTDDIMQSQIQPNETVAQKINNVGRLYYIIPKTGSTRNTSDTKSIHSQLAVCRRIGEKQTLEFVGDATTEDKISFAVTAVDGSRIPKFVCPDGAYTSSSYFTESPEPRLFVVPQIVSSGKNAFPIQGIRAYAEEDTEKNEWIIRLNALVNTQKDATTSRSYWISNIGDKKDATENSPGEMTINQLSNDYDGTNDTSTQYLRAVVIGVCSVKKQPF